MPSSPPCYAPVPSDDLPHAEASVSVSTVAATAVGTGHHILRVEGYSHLKTMHGGYLESTAFMAAGHTWRVCCYLNGARPEDAGFIWVFLRRDAAKDDDESVVHAEYEFALVHHQGTLLKWPSHRKCGTASAFDKGNSWGCPRFISKEDLKRSTFLKDDCFAVRCKVVVQVQEWAVQEDPRPAETTAWKAFARFCGSICG